MLLERTKISLLIDNRLRRTFYRVSLDYLDDREIRFFIMRTPDDRGDCYSIVAFDILNLEDKTSELIEEIKSQDLVWV